MKGLRRAFLIAATGSIVIGCAVAAAPAQVSGSWINPSGGSWSDGANWSCAPLYPDSGGVATFAGDAGSSTGYTAITPPYRGVTLDTIAFEGTRGYSLYEYYAGSLALNGSRTIDCENWRVGSPLHPYTRAQDVGKLFSGSGAIVKTGTGAVSSNSGFTTGSVSILAGSWLGYYGLRGAAVTLDGGTYREAYNGYTAIASLTVGAAGGTIELLGNSAFFSVTELNGGGQLSGSGQLVLSGIGSNTVSADSTALFIIGGSQHVADGFTGSIAVRSGTLELGSAGAHLDHASGVTVRGATLLIRDDSSSGVAPSDRLVDVPIELSAGTLNLSTTYVTAHESAGTLTLAGGKSTVRIDRYDYGVSGSSLAVKSLARFNRSTLSIYAPQGEAYAGGFTVTDGSPPLIGGGSGSFDLGIVPWAIYTVGSGTSTGGDFCTFSLAEGFRPLAFSEYAVAMPSGVTTKNVKLWSGASVGAPVTVNALCLANGTASLYGGATVTVTSGAVWLSGTSSISTPVAFGSAEGIFHGGGGTIDGTISGSGGITVSANRLILNGTNTYTGQTTVVSGTLCIANNVQPGVAGPLGSDASAVVLSPGGGTAGLLLANTTGASITFGRDLLVRGSEGRGYAFIGGAPTFSPSTVTGSPYRLTGKVFLEEGANLFAYRVDSSGDISGDGRLTIMGGTFSGNNSYKGGTEIVGAGMTGGNGSLNIASDSALGSGTVWLTGACTFSTVGSPRTLTNPLVFSLVKLTSTATLETAASLAVSGSQPITLLGPVNLNTQGTIDVAATAPLTMGGDAFGGGLYKNGAGSLSMKNIRLPLLGVNAGTVRVLPGGGTVGTSRLGAITIAGATNAWTAKLDLADHDLVIDYFGTPNSPIATVANQIKSGFANGSWNGNGICSSVAGSNGKVLGYADNVSLRLTAFSGQPVDLTTVLIKFTYPGDANLDGQVDVTDLGALATNWQTSASWTGGDFNYDGFVDVSDLGQLATNWQAGVGSAAGTVPLERAMAAFGLEGTGVPEACTSSLVAAVSVLAILRRRRSAATGSCR